MAGRMSNRDRIAQRAAEAEVARKEKEAKAAQRKVRSSTTTSRAKSPAPPERTRFAWAVCDQSGAKVRVFPYREEAAARAEAERLSEESGKTHFVARTEVPLE